jgi:hypothetical protein
MSVELQLSFPEFTTPASTSPVWIALDDAKRTAVIDMLGHLIAKIVTEHRRVANSEVTGDE